MSRNLAQDRAVTLMELLVAIALLSMIILYFSSLESIGRRTTFLAERKSLVQNEASFVLEHMRQQMTHIIGYKDMQYGGGSINPVFIVSTGGGRRKLIKFWVDHDGDGKFNGDNTAHDWILCYSVRQGNDVVTFDNHTNNYNTNGACGGGETLSNHIVSFVTQPVAIQRNPFNLTSNYLTVSVTACWDPTEAIGACGNERADNPQVTMQTSVQIPGVSVH
jgi:prepilin-type N-terminal cleavage/methylation domain-containing protein